MQYSGGGGECRRVKIRSLVIIALALLGAGAGVGAVAQPLGRQCLGTPGTIDAIAGARLVRPLFALRTAGAVTGAEPVTVKLCLWDRQYVYEIVLLHRDGRIAHVFIDAATGNVVRSPPI